MGARQYVLVTARERCAPAVLGCGSGVPAGSGVVTQSVIVDAGEASKTWTGPENSSNASLSFGWVATGPSSRSAAASWGDLAGFAAATYTRGVPVVQVPTTLLAQVVQLDSGQDGRGPSPRVRILPGRSGKPALVIADTTTLHTLPERSGQRPSRGRQDGAVAGEAATASLETEAHRLVTRDDAAVLAAVADCVRFRRQLLGTTSGIGAEGVSESRAHAWTRIENVLGYGTVSHGQLLRVECVLPHGLPRRHLGQPSELLGGLARFSIVSV